MPVPLNEARAEALASAAHGGLVYDTLELWHPSFIENGNPAPIRAVNDSADLVARLEADAPRNPGASVTFTASSFRLTLPASDESLTGRGSISVGNVAGALYPLLKNALGVAAPLQVFYREYLAADLDQPSMILAPFTLRKVTLDLQTVTGDIVFEELELATFPRRIYTISEFPALQQ